MFRDARNTTIHGGNFVIDNKVGKVSLLDVFYERVAPNAILNAGGRADEVKCHPGTRAEVIDHINKWRMNAQNRSVPASRMFWLSGPAGAGKTAIVQTVAQSWKSQGIHAANFFFFRTDPTRNFATSLVSTLLYQIFDFYPATRDAVEEILTFKPRILDASIEEQFDKLICSPLRAIGPLSSQPIVLLIDGLDECDSAEKVSQGQILHALDTLVSQTDLPFLVLIGSRVEHQITMAFRDLRTTVNSIFLDDQYSPEKDIRLFVTAEFDRIKRTHCLSPQDENWPSPSDVNDIVAKSSNQFIYASTVMRYISASSASPQLTLQKVRGAVKIANKSPFSHLDAMYTHILSQVEDQQALKDILHTRRFVSTLPQADYAYREAITFLEALNILDNRYTDSVIASCIADLAAIARYDQGEVFLYHASLTDYLEDQSRSGVYHVDIDSFELRILPLLFGRKTYIAYRCLSRLKAVTLEIMRAQLSLDHYIVRSRGVSPSLLTRLYNLCVSHDAIPEFRKYLYRWVVENLQHGFVDDPRCLDNVPYSRRCITMAQLYSLIGDVSRDSDMAVDALRPESASDAHEIALWLQELLEWIYKAHHTYRLEHYKKLTRYWISWAVLNNVPFSDLHEFPDGSIFNHNGAEMPYARKYITMARIEHLNGDVEGSDVVVDTLRPESASDAAEITSWIQDLLYRIHGMYYARHRVTYMQLIGQWIFWALLNDIKLANLANLPYGRWYFWQGTVAKFVTSYLKPDSYGYSHGPILGTAPVLEADVISDRSLPSQSSSPVFFPSMNHNDQEQ